MPLKILPKKRWNVWTRENLARIARDEAKHAADQEQKRKRQADLDQEARLELLKRRRRGEHVDTHAPTPVLDDTAQPLLAGTAACNDCLVKTSSPARAGPEHHSVTVTGAGAVAVAPSADSSVAAGHINFFADMERKLEQDGTARGLMGGQNPEYLAEKKKEEERMLKRNGINNFKLGQSAAETQGMDKPWYHFRSGEAPMRDRRGRALVKGAAIYHRQQDERRKGEADPLALVDRALGTKRPPVPSSHGSATRSGPASRPDPSADRVGSGGVADRSRSQGAEKDKDSQSKGEKKKKKQKHRKKKKGKKERKKKDHRKSRKKGAKTKKRGRKRARSTADSGSSDSESSSSSGSTAGSFHRSSKTRHSSPSMAELRRQRLAREQQEMRRQGKLFLSQAAAAPVPTTQAEAARYSRQFNPHLARRR